MAVTEEDVQFVRRAFESFNATSAEREDEAGILAHFARWYDPDVEIVNADDWPLPASYRGTEGYVRWYRENYGAYEDVRYDVDHLGAVGERVVALVTISGRPRGEDTELVVEIGLVYGMRAGRIASVELYLGHERPMRVAQATLSEPA
jgi:ketosteroid isomerase-like protein